MEKDTIERVKEKINVDRRLSLRYESSSFSLSYGTTNCLVTDVLEMWRVSAR